jgi:formylglycine-generating enzyme
MDPRGPGWVLATLLAAIGCKTAQASKPGADGVRQAAGPARGAAHAGAERGACPPEMAQIEGFCVDRVEASLALVASDGKRVAHPHYQRPESGKTYVAESRRGAFPQAYVNRHEAQAACREAGKRLCSVDEWMAACRGSADTTYPYGPRYKSGKCNVGKAHLLSRFFGADPGNWSYNDSFNNPMLNQQPGFLARSGDHAECTSDYGVYDMVGNLHEWVSDAVDPKLASKLARETGISIRRGLRKGRGIFMGGFYSTTNQHGSGCSFVTVGHEPAYHDYSTGFRCCADTSSQR